MSLNIIFFSKDILENLLLQRFVKDILTYFSIVDLLDAEIVSHKKS